MFNHLLNEGQSVMIFSLMISEIAYLYKDVACENIVKDQFKNDSFSSSSIILKINLFLLILFERITYKKYKIEKFVKKIQL